MILVDTNVISERMRPKPNEKVLKWFRATRRAELYTSTITVAELRAGASVLPQGRRRAELESVIDDVIAVYFRYSVLPFDMPSAESFATVIEQRREAGRPIEMADALIAAVCISQNAPLATRNTKDFDGLGITLINPWEY
ncbi:type II toxin-antitoxin system VapC family toxin [Glycomyces sp. NPDC046736]|uniref:type II toxin-antitoxin system VapC family toxin n=1 Tax=Glycomyces sp. NPDC046736 TaxID=3155615 RepID=UPI0033ED4A7E